ncbi:unnamed protein product [Kluyveromyces dobzhanskii CBS 2104]|uniref:WGS project CCBQ000000000 data, contig 00058 n=1 Tax=Kluyveromyces dobzhanskii CBS 2104 TaxID=1427455 RepID=A0A0A8LDR9_9SACH|nr:unnamed protein product [Kluyveromyces dobzhanskii CBS 2104]
MSIPTTQKAVLIEGDKAVVKSNVPVPELSEGTVLLKIEAVAGNPTDWKHVAYGLGPQGSILGCDVAGTVVKLGPNASDFVKVGDTGCSFVHGASQAEPTNGGFAEYAKVHPDMFYKAKLTHTTAEDITEGPVKYFETAASLPVSLTTAGMILTYNLGTKLKWHPSTPQHDYPLLIWGGATAAGQQLIQLAKNLNAYTKIVVVASKKNETLLKSFGADDIFDYHDADVIEQIKSKYPNLQHVVDAVSTPESFVQAYKATADDSPATLLQLTMLSAKDIPEADQKENVKIDTTLLYRSSGTEVKLGPWTLPALPEYREATRKFIKFVNPYVESGEIHHMNIHVFKNGLTDVPELTEGIKNGKNKNVKYVASL